MERAAAEVTAEKADVERAAAAGTQDEVEMATAADTEDAPVGTGQDMSGPEHYVCDLNIAAGDKDTLGFIL